MKEEGFSVTNTSGEDLDKNQLVFSSENQDVVTAFEIFEHLLNPYTILSEIKSDKLSIPLRLWFSPPIEVKRTCGIGIIMNLKIGNWTGC
jgi:2-polyprenyl-3-methyl-5-hydroxy-6-metoxy-1,4-benzoquinol methylase